MTLRIDKNNGGYHDVLVAIEESAEPNETVVEAVKVLLRAASQSLHRATGGHVHLASVTLAIPRHWPQRPGVKQVPYDPWSRADIRVVDGGPWSLWPQQRAPVALHTAACGQRGEHVLLPMAALPPKLSSDKTAKALGYQLAQEWARYRYGVLGEFATTGDVWYVEESCNATFPATCANAFGGVVRRPALGLTSPADPTSLWQLITSSDDFKGGDVTVTKLKEAVASVFVDKLAEGTLVSLVYFSNGSSVHNGPMTLIKASRSDIAHLTLLAPMQGPTCTLCGLQIALQISNSTPGQSPEGSLVILFSDGKATGSLLSSTEEDTGDFLAVVPDFQRDRVIITTVAVGATASRNLEKLALETGGRTYAICDINAKVAEGRCWMGVLNALFDTTDELPSVVASDVDLSRSKSKANHDGIGDGRSSGLLQVQTGLCLDDPIGLQVRVPEHVDTYRAAVVLASLTKGLCPVVHANVKGVAFFQNNSTGEEFLLHDSGLGEDIYANDGTYTGQFTKFRGRGRYTIVIEVSNTSQTEFLDWATNNVLDESSAVAGEHASTGSSPTGVRGHSTGAFSETSAGHPLFVNVNINVSQMPPGRVRDLKASFESHEGRPTARLSWTMPGAHAFEGTVTTIDVRSSRSIQTMLDFFDAATSISEQDLVSGSMKPLPAFSHQLATIYIPPTVIFGRSENESATQAPSASGYNVYFALVTANADGSRSEVSNLASVNVPGNFTVPEGIALAGAALFVPVDILDAKNDSKSTDAMPKPETMAMSPWEELLSIPVSSDTNNTPSAAPQTSHEETPAETKKAMTSEKTTKPQETTFPTTKNTKEETTSTVSTPKRKEVVDNARAATKEEVSTPEPQSELQSTPVNGSEADQNATAPPHAEKNAVNKSDAEDDDGPFSCVVTVWRVYGSVPSNLCKRGIPVLQGAVRSGRWATRS
ncbi:hypothetical protein MTO96_026215 [Rhipicephalus appendiculatus]